MLTADLLRARVAKDRVIPRFVDARAADIRGEATALRRIFEQHVGKTAGDLDEALADHIGDSTDYLLQRGLAKLLRDKCTFEITATRPPSEIREVVFKLAAKRWPVGLAGADGEARAAVLAEAAAALDMTVEAIEDGLFADLNEAQRLTTAELPSPGELLHRYNLALAQAVLYRAREVEVRLVAPTAKRARQLIRWVKFHRLMHEARRDGDDWVLVLDGPLSLLRQTNRYGLQLALFLDALCLVEQWKMTAEVAWGKARKMKTMVLDHTSGLVSTRRDTGTWTGDEEAHFVSGWESHDPDWKLSDEARLVDLDGRGVLVPDYVLRHPDGREVLLEIVWFWKKHTFERRLALLREVGPPNLIVALATRYNTDGEKPDVGDAAVYPFKGVIQPKKIVALAEQVAAPPLL